MKYLILILLMSCSKKEIAEKVKKEIACQRQVNGYESFLLRPGSIGSLNFGPSRCELSLQMPDCPCSGVDVLPLSCTDTTNQLLIKFESLQENMREWDKLLKDLKSDKDQSLVKEIKKIRDRDKQELEDIKNNIENYSSLCLVNEIVRRRVGK